MCRNSGQASAGQVTPGATPTGSCLERILGFWGILYYLFTLKPLVICLKTFEHIGTDMENVFLLSTVFANWDSLNSEDRRSKGRWWEPKKLRMREWSQSIPGPPSSPFFCPPFFQQTPFFEPSPGRGGPRQQGCGRGRGRRRGSDGKGGWDGLRRASAPGSV